MTLPCTAYTGDGPCAFVSYAHRDAEIVYPEIQRLDLMGYRLWYDEGIDPGNEWPEEVAGALKRSAQFVVFVTNRAAVSRNVRNEINYALRLNKPFLAIHLDETELPPGMDLQMSSIQAIFKWQMNEQTYVRNLGRALPRELGSTLTGQASNSNEGLIDLFARAMHTDYLEQSGLAGVKVHLPNWHQLGPAIKADSLAICSFFLTMLHLAGFNVSEAREGDVPLVFTPEDLEALSRMEHDRWSRKRIEEGWRRGDSRDQMGRLHPMLTSWSNMPVPEKDKDRSAVQRLPTLLLKAGYAITSLYEQPDRTTLFEPGNHKSEATRQERAK